MKNKIYSRLPAIMFGVLVVSFLAAFYIFAWTEPTAVPPGGNVPAPINVSSVDQIKQGSLSLNIAGISPTGLIVNRDVIFLNGNVGIGTTGPVEKLDVSGNIVASGSICANGGSDCVGSGGGYSYTYYSTSLSSCSCPSGETKKKDLGSWGFCNQSFDFSGDRDLFRPPGLSCADISSYHSWYNVDRGLACVCGS